jgi:glucosamine 6-phosphate synthetase-like amidotransferase/phosphosugar isomerase protein
MCGIAGLTLFDAGLEPELGALLAGMLTALGERGPDSAGVAVYHGDGQLDVTKEVGRPAEICDRFAIAAKRGYQGVGHTRMATESAVTRAHCHPFTPAEGVCVVHNGSFSNHATVRRRLERDGIAFDSDNDSEVAARFIAQRLAHGDDLRQALTAMAGAMDGFYTLLVTTPTEFAVHRDPVACKPAVIAQTDGYIAMASEYRALTGLPGIKDAKVFEPTGLHTWTR